MNTPDRRAAVPEPGLVRLPEGRVVRACASRAVGLLAATAAVLLLAGCGSGGSNETAAVTGDSVPGAGGLPGQTPGEDDAGSPGAEVSPAGGLPDQAPGEDDADSPGDEVSPAGGLPDQAPGEDDTGSAGDGEASGTAAVSTRQLPAGAVAPNGQEAQREADWRTAWEEMDYDEATGCYVDDFACIDRETARTSTTTTAVPRTTRKPAPSTTRPPPATTIPHEEAHPEPGELPDANAPNLESAVHPSARRYSVGDVLTSSDSKVFAGHRVIRADDYIYDRGGICTMHPEHPDLRNMFIGIEPTQGFPVSGGRYDICN